MAWCAYERRPRCCTRHLRLSDALRPRPSMTRAAWCMHREGALGRNCLPLWPRSLTKNTSHAAALCARARSRAAPPTIGVYYARLHTTNQLAPMPPLICRAARCAPRPVSDCTPPWPAVKAGHIPRGLEAGGRACCGHTRLWSILLAPVFQCASLSAAVMACVTVSSGAWMALAPRAAVVGTWCGPARR